MELELEYENEDDIPAAHKELYTEKDGKWLFTAIKMPAASKGSTKKLEDTLKKVREELKTAQTSLKKFEGIDPEKIHDDIAELEELRLTTGDKKPDEGQIAKLVDAQVQRKTAALQRENEKLRTELGEASTERDTLRTERKTDKIKSAASTAAAKLKVVPEALDDVLMRAEREFDLDEEGGISNKDGISIDDWLTDRTKDKPHWFPRVNGGGGRGSDGKPGGVNPWTKSSWSVTAQGAIMREDRAKAERMATAAGSKIGATSPPES